MEDLAVYKYVPSRTTDSDVEGSLRLDWKSKNNNNNNNQRAKGYTFLNKQIKRKNIRKRVEITKYGNWRREEGSSDVPSVYVAWPPFSRVQGPRHFAASNFAFRVPIADSLALPVSLIPPWRPLAAPPSPSCLSALLMELCSTN